MPSSTSVLKKGTPEMTQKVLLSLLEDVYSEKEKLDQQSKVNFSLLEDVNQAQKKLKHKYFEIEVLRKVSEEIGYTLDLKRVLEILSKSIEKLLDFATVSYMLFEEERGEVVFNVYLREKIGPVFLKAIKKNTQEAFQALAPTVTDTDIKIHYFGKKIDKESKTKPQSLFNVPMIVQDKTLGMMNIASTQPDLYEPEEMEPIYTMASQASLAIARLRELIASEHSRLKDLVKSMTDGVLMFDINKRIIIANPVMEKIIHITEKHLTFPKFLKILNPTKKAKTDLAIATLAKGEKRKKIDITAAIDKTLASAKTNYIKEFPFKNRFYEIFITPVRGYQKKVTGGAIILHDITHIKAIDRMKTEFVSVASHQLRTSLTAIKLFSEMLADKKVGKLNEKQKNYLNDIRQSTERMIKLVNDLLNVSRIETGRLMIKPEPIQLHDFIQNIINDAKPLAQEKKCKIIFQKPKIKLPKIPIDTSLMRQVIHNLITNAIRYSKINQCSILVKLEQQDNNCLISVKDSGIGIPKKIQPKIFKKFYRADNAQKAEAEGSGLGLYVAKMIMEASGGKIWFKSPARRSLGAGGEKDKGTTFFVTIPIHGMKEKAGEQKLAE